MCPLAGSAPMVFGPDVKVERVSVFRAIRTGSQYRLWTRKPIRTSFVVVIALAAALVVALLTPSFIAPAGATTPTPVQAASTSDIRHDVVISPSGTWHAVLVDRDTSTQRFLISSDGVTWQSVAAPRSTAPWVASMAISDTGELYAIATDPTVSYYRWTDFWKYNGSWSSATAVGTGSSNMNSGAGEIVTDGSNLVVVESQSGRMFKSTNDGGSWSTGQSLTNGFNGYYEQTVVVGGIVHVLQVGGTGNPYYQRWDIATASNLVVDAEPPMSLYQWSPYLVSAPGSSSTLYIATVDNSGSLFVYQSTNSGDAWHNVVASDPFPVELGTPAGFEMRADGRLDAFGSTYAAGSTRVLEVSHPVDRLGDWSSVTELASVAGDSAAIGTWPTQRADAAQAATIEAWVSVPHGTGTFDLYWFTSTGATVSPPAATPFTTSGSLVRGDISQSITYGIGSEAISPSRAWEAALILDGSTGAQSVLRSQDGINWLELPNPSPYFMTAVSVNDDGEVDVVTPDGSGSAYYRSSNFYRWSSGRWYGPITFASRSANFDSQPQSIIRAGNDLISIESPSGRVSYSTDDGDTWNTYTKLNSGFGTGSNDYTVVGSMLHVVNGSTFYSRWSLTDRAESSVATPPSVPTGAAISLMPDRGHANDLWMGFVTSSQSGLDHSTDNGNTWTTVDAGSSLPSGFTAKSMALGGDGRVYVFGCTGAWPSSLVRYDRSLSASAGWSAPTVINSAQCGEPLVAVPSAAPVAAPPGVWDLQVDMSNTSVDVLHHFGKFGGPAPIPAAQTYGPSTESSLFASRPQLALSDPVSSATGSFTDQATDAVLPAVGEPLAMTRTYNSADSTAGVLGRGWTFDYDTSLTVAADTVTLRSGDGQQVVYTENPDGSYAAPPGGLASLVKNVGGTYTVTTKARGHFNFDSSGKLTSITNRNNQGSTLTYTSGKLTGVSGAGRSMAFAYNAAGLLSTVTLPDGRYVAYTYTGGLLTDVRDLLGHHTVYAYDTGNRLSSVLDANGITRSVIRTMRRPGG